MSFWCRQVGDNKLFYGIYDETLCSLWSFISTSTYFFGSSNWNEEEFAVFAQFWMIIRISMSFHDFLW
jgi:hypothetical protein